MASEWIQLRNFKCPVSGCPGANKPMNRVCAICRTPVFISQTGYMRCDNLAVHGGYKHYGKLVTWKWNCGNHGDHPNEKYKEADLEGFTFALAHAVQLMEEAGEKWVGALCLQLAEQYTEQKGGCSIFLDNRTDVEQSLMFGYKFTANLPRVRTTRTDSDKDRTPSRHQELADKSSNKTPKGFALPSHWAHMDGNSFKSVQIDVGTHEWDTVEYKIKTTIPNVNVLSVQRIQNVYIWEIYAITKRKLERKYGAGNANELDLFHGTTHDRISVISEQNLDPRLAGNSTGTVYGQGTYFAMEAKYSDAFAEDRNGKKFMFMAKVLAGKICIGRSSYRRPPPQDRSNPNSILYDSCVDDVGNPRIYCIFHDSQFYPQYLIEYM